MVPVRTLSPLRALYRDRRIFLVYSLLYIAASMGMAAVIFSSNEDAADGPLTTPAFVMYWVGLYSGTAFYFLRRNLILKRFAIAIFVVPLLFISSTSWSLMPSKTLTYATIVLANAAFAAVIVSKISTEELFSIFLAAVIGMVTLGLLLFFIGVESVKYVDTHQRVSLLGLEPVRGFFNHKITAGFFSGLAFYVAIHLLKGVIRVVICLILLAFILFTGSSSALVMLASGAMLVALISALRRIRASTGMTVFAFVVLPLIILVVAVNTYEPVLIALGRDPTFTGRTLLWAWGLEAAMQQPLQGWGYVGYNGSDIAARIALSFDEFQNYLVPHFHNSYVQFFVEMGFIFGGAIIASYFVLAVYFVRRYITVGEAGDRLMAFSLLWIMVSGVFIHTMGRYNDFSMLIYFCAIGYALKKRKVVGDFAHV